MALDGTPQDQKELEDQVVTENGELMDDDISMSSDGETKVQAELDQEAQDATDPYPANRSEHGAQRLLRQRLLR